MLCLQLVEQGGAQEEPADEDNGSLDSEAENRPSKKAKRKQKKKVKPDSQPVKKAKPSKATVKGEKKAKQTGNECGKSDRKRNSSPPAKALSMHLPAEGIQRSITPHHALESCNTSASKRLYIHICHASMHIVAMFL